MAEQTPVDVYLLTGYLGSGKTTTLNHLLGGPIFVGHRTALLINEFGKLGVDGALVASEQAAGKYEINQGSLFCSCTQDQLLGVLDTLVNDVRPEVLLIEATGIAEPTDFLQLVRTDHLRRHFRVRATVALVDAKVFPAVLPNLRAARRQVELADGLVINKTDLVEPADLEKLETLLGEMNPTAPQCRVTYGQIDPDWLEQIAHVDRGGEMAEAPPIDIFSVSFGHDEPVDRGRFEQVIGEYGSKLLRLKGNVDFGKGPRFVELVGSELMQRDEPAALQGSATQFAVIAWGASRDELIAAFQSSFS